MQAGGIKKASWHWTRAGWKRSPKRLQTVKKIAAPTKRRSFKRVVVQPASAEKPPTFAEARKLAAEQGMAESAPTPAPEAATRATRPPRRAWGGKYDALTNASQ